MAIRAFRTAGTVMPKTLPDANIAERLGKEKGAVGTGAGSRKVG